MILGIYGAGSLGREVMEIALDINQVNSRWDKILYIIDEGFTVSDNFRGDTVYFSEYASIDEDKEAVIANGELFARVKMAEKIEREEINLAEPIIHPFAKVARGASIGNGTVISFGSFISFNTKIGKNVYVQPSSGVGHDVKVGDNCVISAGVRIAGHSSIGRNTYIGLNVPVRDRINIGEGSIISMGSVVQRDIPDNVIAMGNPARAMKENKEHKLF